MRNSASLQDTVHFYPAPCAQQSKCMVYDVAFLLTFLHSAQCMRTCVRPSPSFGVFRIKHGQTVHEK